MLVTAVVTPMIPKIGPNSITGFSLTTTTGFVVGTLAILGMIGLLFTSYRTVVGYFLAGMVYWLVVEVLAWGIMTAFSLDPLHGYVVAVGLTFIPILLGLNWLDNRKNTLKLSPPMLKKTSNIVSHFKPSASNASNAKYPPILVAGQRPFIIEQDTDFLQHYIRHTPVFDYE